jgi:hypothetical protein
LALRVGIYPYKLTKSIRLHADESRDRLEICGKAGLQPDRKQRNVGLWPDQNTKNMVEMARISADFGSFTAPNAGQ